MENITNKRIIGWINEEYERAEQCDENCMGGCQTNWEERIKEANAAQDREAAEWAIMWWRMER